MSRRVKSLVVSAALVVAGVSAARAQPAPKNDAIDIPAGAISLSEASRIAERHAKGKAIRAELENIRSGVAYDVEVVTDSEAVFDVVVDPSTGKVLSSEADAADHDDEADAAD